MSVEANTRLGGGRPQTGAGEQASPRARGLTDRVADLDRLGSLAVLQRRLHATGTPCELFALAADLVCCLLPFDRAIVLAPANDVLTAASSEPALTPGNEALRLRAQAPSVPLTPGSDEAEYLRRPRAFEHRDDAFPALRAGLGITRMAVSAVTPEEDPVALIVADRGTWATTSGADGTLDVFAHLVAASLGRVILRARLDRFERELRRAEARQMMVHDAINAPIVVSRTDHHPSTCRSRARRLH